MKSWFIALIGIFYMALMPFVLYGIMGLYVYLLLIWLLPIYAIPTLLLAFKRTRKVGGIIGIIVGLFTGILSAHGPEFLGIFGIPAVLLIIASILGLWKKW